MEKRSWVAFLSSDNYLEGLLVLKKNLEIIKSKYPLFVCVTDNVTQRVLKQLQIQQIQYKIVPFILGPSGEDGCAHWSNTLGKLYIFNLPQIDKAIYLDLDLLILKNIDDLFDLPVDFAMPLHCLYDYPQYKLKMISSVLVFKPSEELFNEIFNQYKINPLGILENHGDECFIEAYVSKHGVTILPIHYNFQVGLFHWKFIAEGLKYWERPYIIHFEGEIKPWLNENYFSINKYIPEEIRQVYQYILKQVRAE